MIHRGWWRRRMPICRPLGLQWQWQPALALLAIVASGFCPELRRGQRRFPQCGADVCHGAQTRSALGNQRWSESNARGRSGAERPVCAVRQPLPGFIENVKLNCPSDPSCIKHRWCAVHHLYVAEPRRVRIWGARLRGGWALAPQWRADMAVAGPTATTPKPITAQQRRASARHARSDLGQQRTGMTCA